jgi:hypothetical protein
MHQWRPTRRLLEIYQYLVAAVRKRIIATHLRAKIAVPIMGLHQWTPGRPTAVLDNLETVPECLQQRFVLGPTLGRFLFGWCAPRLRQNDPLNFPE